MSAEDPPAVDARAFDLGSGRDAALCLHGLTGTPYEVRRLGEALAEHGVRAVGPCLPGHGGEPEALAEIPYEAWLEAARARYRALRAEHERVFVLGLSLGGLLSLCLAAEEPDVDAVVAVGTPLQFHTRLVPLIPVVKRLLPYLRKRRGSDIRDPVARAVHPSMPVMPMAGVHELVKLQQRVRPLLAQIQAPILVAHGRLDYTAHPDDARTIARTVGSPERELCWLGNSGHVVPVDHDGPHLAARVAAFVTRSRRSPLR
ncbi:MAG: alpha/beta fold hydrolase [Myxococcota bacterium]